MFFLKNEKTFSWLIKKRNKNLSKKQFCLIAYSLSQVEPWLIHLIITEYTIVSWLGKDTHTGVTQLWGQTKV